MEIILSKLHIPSLDLGSTALAVSISAPSFCSPGPEGGPRQRFGAENEPACALPSTQGEKKKILIILDVLILSKWENNPSAYK